MRWFLPRRVRGQRLARGVETGAGQEEGQHGDLVVRLLPQGLHDLLAPAGDGGFVAVPAGRDQGLGPAAQADRAVVVGVEQFPQGSREGGARVGAQAVVGLLEPVAAPALVLPPAVGRSGGFLQPRAAPPERVGQPGVQLLPACRGLPALEAEHRTADDLVVTAVARAVGDEGHRAQPAEQFGGLLLDRRAEHVLVQLLRERAGQGGGPAGGIGLPLQEPLDGGAAGVPDLLHSAGLALGEGGDQDRQPPRQAQDHLDDPLVRHSLSGEQLTGLGVREHLKGPVGDQVVPVLPAPGGQPGLSGEGDQYVGGQLPVAFADQYVPQPGVQHRSRALVGVEEQHDPRVSAGDVGELLQEHRGQGVQWGEHEFDVAVSAQPGAEERFDAVRAGRDLVRVDRAGEGADTRDHAQSHQSQLGGDHARRRRGGAPPAAGSAPAAATATPASASCLRWR